MYVYAQLLYNTIEYGLNTKAVWILYCYYIVHRVPTMRKRTVSAIRIFKVKLGRQYKAQCSLVCMLPCMLLWNKMDKKGLDPFNNKS